MGVLEDIKRQAQKILDSRSAASGRAQDLQELYKTGLIAATQRVFDYLHEVVYQLNVVQPEIGFEFPLNEATVLHGAQQGDYVLVCESGTHSERVTLRFSVYSDGAVALTADDPAATDRPLQELKRLGLVLMDNTDAAATSEPGAGTQFSSRARVPVSFDFRADFKTGVIRLEVKNFERLGAENGYALDPENLEEQSMDEFAKLVLRQRNKFIETARARDKTTARLGDHGVQHDPSLPNTEELNASLVRSLFNRGKSLQLTYRNTIAEVSPAGEELVMGRSGQCELVVNSDVVSRRHAIIAYRKGKFILSDQSTNGTFVRIQGGKEVYLLGEDFPLSGSGSISLGESISISNEHVIYFNCQ